jgi:hypothetical protein
VLWCNGKSMIIEYLFKNSPWLDLIIIIPGSLVVLYILDFPIPSPNKPVKNNKKPNVSNNQNTPIDDNTDVSVTMT